MRAEHLRQWLHEATREKEPDTTNWQKVVAIVKSELRDEDLSKDST